VKPVMVELKDGDHLIFDEERPHLRVSRWALEAAPNSDDLLRYCNERFKRACERAELEASLARAKTDDATHEREAICEFLLVSAHRLMEGPIIESLVRAVREHLVHHRKATQ